MVPAGLLLLGAIKSFHIACRATTNTKSAVALGLVLLGWLSFSLTPAAKLWLEDDALWVTLLTAATGLILLVVGVTLAILGLQEVRASQGAYRQGRAQSIWALVLAGLNVLMFAIGLGAALVKNGEITARLAPTSAEAGTELKWPEFNCELSAPAGWVRFDVKMGNPDAALGLMRGRPQVFFMLIAERIGVEAGLSTEQLAELAHTNTRSVARTADLGDWHPESVNGIEGLQSLSRVTLPVATMWYEHWVAQRGGYCYQLITSADARRCSRSELHRYARDVRVGFRQLDPLAVARSGVDAAPAELVSDRFGYRLTTDGSWSRWDSLAEDFPEAETGVLGFMRALSVVPVALPDVRVDPRSVADALLACLDIDAARLIDRSPLGGFMRFDFEHARAGEDETRYEYRLRVLVGERAAYLVSAWAQEGTAKGEDLARSLEGFDGDPRFVPPPPDEWTATERARHAPVYASLARSLSAQGAEARSLELWQIASACAPDDADIRFGLLHALLAAGRYEDTVRVTEQGLEHHPENLTMRSFRAFARAHIGQQDEAVEEFETIFRAGYRDVNDLRFCTNAMIELDRYDDALDLVEHVMEGSDSSSLRILHSELLLDHGDFARALDGLERERELRPYDEALEWALFDAYSRAERHHDALSVARRLSERGAGTPDVALAKARAEYALGWYRHAKSTLQDAIDRWGADAPGLSDWLDSVNGVLGEGSNRLLREVIEPVDIPGPETAPDAAPDSNGHDAAILDRSVAYRFEEGGQLRTTYRSTIRVNTAAGVSKLSTLHYSFDPLSQSVHVNHLVVRDSDGHEVARGQLADYFVLDDQSSGYATQDQQVQVPVPGLAIGCTVEVMVTYREWAGSDGMRFVECPLYSQYPTGRYRLVVTGDVDRVRHVASPGLEPVERDGALIWTVVDPPLAVAESSQPDRVPEFPTVWLGSGDSSWSDVAGRYVEALSDRFVADDTVAAAAAGIVGDVEGDAERAMKLARYVQREITYRAIEFGQRAQIPAPAGATLEKRYGDCKDHSLLLHQLLRAIGVRSHLALVNTAAPIVESLPSLDQFDHVIVYCPDLGDGRFFDCTDKHLDLAFPTPIALADRPALVIDPDDPRFVTIPAYPIEASTIRAERDIELTIAGIAHVRERLELTGYYASFLRGYLTGLDADQRRLAIQREYAIFAPGVEVESVTVDNQENLEGDLVLECTYRVPSVLHVSGDRISGRVPAGWERRYLELEHLDRRRTPFVMRYPLRFDSTVTLHAAPGTQLESFGAETARDDRGRFGRSERTVEREATAVTLHSSVFRPAGSFAASEYDEATEFVDECLAGLEAGFTLSR